MMTEKRRCELDRLAANIRIETLHAISSIGIGHVGGSLSIAEALAVLYGDAMRVDPADPQKPDRDRLILSKGHAGPALYAALALKGFFPPEWLETLNQPGTRLPSHADRQRTPGIDMSTGSLGQGLSVGCGMALGLKNDGLPSDVFVLTGDGELDEGQNWEAALFAAHFRLDNLIALADYNKQQLDGFTDEILSLGELTDKFGAFGWETAAVDGHDVASIAQAIADMRANRGNGKPKMIVLNTIKGRGWSASEGLRTNHNMPVTREQFAQARDEILAALAKKTGEEAARI